MAPTGVSQGAATEVQGTPVSAAQPPVSASQPLEVENAAKTGNPQDSKKISRAWQHFTMIPETVGTDKPKAACNYCKKKYLAGSRAHGTSNLLNHIDGKKCKEYEKLRKSKSHKQSMIVIDKSHQNVGDGLRLASFSTSEARKALARMIVIDEMPFRTVDGEGFRNYSMTFQPKFSLPSRKTVQRDFFKIYEEEKAKLKSMLHSQRVCLTTDTWTSVQNLNYMCLTSHWIDDKWKLHKRVLSFPTIANHKGETIGLSVMNCLKDWAIEKIFTVTVDNASTNDGAIKHIIRRTKETLGTVLHHEYIHMRCCAHILNIIVQEGLKEVDDAIIKIRNAVRYVRSSPARMQSILKCVEEEKINCTNRVCLDVETRWNSTYHMLVVAEKYEKAFDKLDCEDSRYSLYFRGRGKKRQKLMGPPACEDWKNARCLVEFLRLFYNATLKFSGTAHVTSNNFFHELVAVQQGILNMTRSEDSILSGMAFRMLGKFSKYWVQVDNLNSLLHIAVVLDPRYKLRYVEFCMEMIYDAKVAASFAETLESKFLELYAFYLKENLDSGIFSAPTISHDLAKVISGGKSEAQRYLADVAEPETEDFDILMWWKVHSTKYPIISKMARDVLAVPISTVASESTFSTSGRVLDPYRSSLSPNTVEALVCCEDWLRATPKTVEPKNDDFGIYFWFISLMSTFYTSLLICFLVQSNHVESLEVVGPAPEPSEANAGK
ncbi:unnamed protein product [Linum tenue]|uniref:BED-type domain-containing protein n=1 Tax=Linum tenue TaxID=586396 RepID=A0AAV0MSF6_9ROSI|nr:unnamed protein product [Linum tenue]